MTWSVSKVCVYGVEVCLHVRMDVCLILRKYGESNAFRGDQILAITTSLITFKMIVKIKV